MPQPTRGGRSWEEREEKVKVGEREGVRSLHPGEEWPLRTVGVSQTVGGRKHLPPDARMVRPSVLNAVRRRHVEPTLGGFLRYRRGVTRIGHWLDGRERPSRSLCFPSTRVVARL